jgi:hypothetical protein
MTAESAVLVATGGLAGVVFAVAALDVLRRATSISLARIGDVQVGWPAVAFAAAVCAAITFVFGAVALLQSAVATCSMGCARMPGSHLNHVRSSRSDSRS